MDRIGCPRSSSEWIFLVGVPAKTANLLAIDPKEIRDQRADRQDIAKRLTDQALKWRKSLP